MIVHHFAIVTSDIRPDNSQNKRPGKYLYGFVLNRKPVGPQHRNTRRIFRLQTSAVPTEISQLI